MILESRIILLQKKSEKLYKEIEKMRNVGHESKFHRNGKYSKVGSDFGLGDVIPSTYVDPNVNYDAGGGGSDFGMCGREGTMFDKANKFGIEAKEKKELIIPVLGGIAVGAGLKFVLGVGLIPSIGLGFIAAGIGSGIVHHMNTPKSPLLPPPTPIKAATPPLASTAIHVTAVAFNNPPGVSVIGVQHALNVQGFASPELVEDGKAGPLTQAAVKKAQAQYGLPVNGTMDAKLVAALEAATAAAPSYNASTAAAANASTPLVPPLADL